MIAAAAFFLAYVHRRGLAGEQSVLFPGSPALRLRFLGNRIGAADDRPVPDRKSVVNIFGIVGAIAAVVAAVGTVSVRWSAPTTNAGSSIAKPTNAAGTAFREPVPAYPGKPADEAERHTLDVMRPIAFVPLRMKNILSDDNSQELAELSSS